MEKQIKSKCSECKYRKWYGDYSLYYCDLSGRVIQPYYLCDIQAAKDKVEKFEKEYNECQKKSSIP